MAQPALLGDFAAQQIEEHLRVLDIREQGLPAIAARRHVVARAGIFDAKGTGHADIIPESPRMDKVVTLMKGGGGFFLRNNPMQSRNTVS